jgi:hypothetical protein
MKPQLFSFSSFKRSLLCGFAALACAAFSASAQNFALLPHRVAANPAQGQTIFFPSTDPSTSIPSGLRNSLPNTFTLSPPTFAFEATVLTPASKASPGTVRLTSLKLYKNGAPIRVEPDDNAPAYRELINNFAFTFPEFIWVYNTAAREILPYRVTHIAPTFLSFFNYQQSNGIRLHRNTAHSLTFSGHVPTFERTSNGNFWDEELLDKASADDVSLTFAPTFVSTSPDGLLNAGSPYFFGDAPSANHAVIGGLQVANQLGFDTDNLHRDNTLTNAELAHLLPILKSAGVTHKLVLTLGRTLPDVTPTPNDFLHLDPDLLDIPDLHFKASFIRNFIAADLTPTAFSNTILTDLSAIGSQIFNPHNILLPAGEPTLLTQVSDIATGTADPNVFALTLPFAQPFPFAAPNVFASASFGSLSNNTFTPGPAQSTFILGGQSTPPNDVPKPHPDLHPHAFDGATLYVPLDRLHDYIAALPSANVLPYDLPKLLLLGAIPNAKLITKNAVAKPWTLPFADIHAHSLRLVINNPAHFTHYSFTGFDVPGLTTADSTRDIDDLEPDDFGFDLYRFPINAGFYILKLFKSYADANPSTFVLHLIPTDLTADLIPDSLTIPYTGPVDGDAFKGALASFDSSHISFPNFDLASVTRGKLIPQPISTIPSLTLPDTFTTIPHAFTFSFSGNSTGSFPIPLKVTSSTLTSVLDTNDVPNLNFDPKTKAYDLHGHYVTIAGFATSDTAFFYSVKIYNPNRTNLDLITDQAFISVDYTHSDIPTDIAAATPPSAIGSHPITLTGHGFLNGALKTSFTVQPSWAGIAAISTDPNDYHLAQLLTFNGDTLITDFTNLISPTDLAPADYSLLATTADLKGDYTLTSPLHANLKPSDFSHGPIYHAAEYSFFLAPAGSFLHPAGSYKFTDALYVGFISVAPLAASDLATAAILSELGKDTFTVSFGKVFLGTPDSVVTISDKTDAENGVFVFFNPTDAKSITGLTGTGNNVLALTLPSGEPSLLTPNTYTHDGFFAFPLDSSLNLFSLFKPDGTPTLDWITRISFSLSPLDAKHFHLSPEGILTASSEWNGSVSILYTPLNPKASPLRLKLNLTAFDPASPPPTSVLTPTSPTFGSASTDTSTDTSTPTFFTLTGRPLGSTLPSTPGLYLLRSPSSVTKLLIK